MKSALRALRARIVVTMVTLGLTAMVGIAGALAFSAAPASAKGHPKGHHPKTHHPKTHSNCRSLSSHHFRTPHKDGDGDGCDHHGPDDGDGPTT